MSNGRVERLPRQISSEEARHRSDRTVRQFTAIVARVRAADDVLHGKGIARLLVAGRQTFSSTFSVARGTMQIVPLRSPRRPRIATAQHDDARASAESRRRS